jgi:hypothetical protein
MKFSEPYILTMSMETEDFSFSEYDELPEDSEFEESKLELDFDENLEVDDQYEMLNFDYSNEDE